jgi:hypothetical protein
MKHTDKPRFYSGDLVITDLAADALSQTEIMTALMRHKDCDWGNVGDADRAQNELSLREGSGALCSVYPSEQGGEFWVITDWDRSKTTVLMPEDYER